MASEGTDAGFGPDRPARVARRRWPVLVVAVVLVVGVVVGIRLIEEDRFVSRVEVVLAAPSASVALGADPDAVLLPSDEELALARSEPVADDVVASVGPEPDVEVFLDGPVVVVEATSVEPERAAAAADVHVAAYLAHRSEVLADRFIAAIDRGSADGGGEVNEPALRVLADFVASDQAAVHDPAPVPTDPTGGPLRGDVLLALAAGLVVGGLGVVAFERVDHTIRTRGELERAGGVPVLGRVPDVAGVDSGDRARGLLPEPDPGSSLGESIRALRVALDSAVAAAPPTDASRGQVIGFCGTGRGVGSTTVAVDLAIVAAAAGRRVVLVDADLDDPTAHERFTTDPGPGLVGILNGEISLDQAVCRPPDHPNLVALAAGSRDGGVPDLLAGPRAASFVNSLSVQADLVVIDLGPALESSDTLALAPLADAVVVVAAVDRTDAVDVADTVVDLGTVGATVAGTVLNRAPVTARDRRVATAG